MSSTRTMHLLVGAVAILAASVLATATSVASSGKLDLTWSGENNQLAAGDPFDMVLSTPGGGSASPFTVESSAGTVTCPSGSTNGLSGKDLTNNQKTDTIEVNSAHGNLHEETRCASTSALGSEPFVSVIPEEGLTLSLSSKGKAKLKGRIAIDIVYSRGACLYGALILRGTMKLEPWVEGLRQVSISLNHHLSLRAVGERKGCAGKATVRAVFGYQLRDAGSFGTGEYIFGHLD